MKGNGRLDLRRSLLLADSLLRQTGHAASFALATVENDPLRLNLPPIVGSGSSSITPDSATLQVMATLYLQAELEQAGVIPVADMLADARYQLSINNVQSAKLLDEFYRNRREWPDRKSREHIFARVFGMGSTADSYAGSVINRDFQSCFANLCLSIKRFYDDARWRKTADPTLDTAIKQTATNLLVNLGSRGFGDLYDSARRIQDELNRAIKILSDEGIGNSLRSRGMWNVLRAVLSPNVPDFARLTTRGQSGLQLLNWLAVVLPLVAESRFTRPLIEPNSPVPGLAESWLTATGFDLAAGNNTLRRAA